MKAFIRQKALELGFDVCRFTTAQAPRSKRHFENWLADGRHGEMSYLQRNARKRVDPRQVLAEARSIITLAVTYHQGEAPGEGLEREKDGRGSAQGRVARYARYADYHDVLAGPLQALTELVDAADAPTPTPTPTPARSLWYVDTGPFLERDLAQRAGAGFIGKHTNLINRRLGNWFFLAEIITTREFEPDEAEKNRCGTCTRCLDACPTRAITAPFQLDARLCISYLTIELKGSIPVDLRPAIGDRIYGCDDCLAVCPWNRFARAGRLMKPRARPDLRQPDLLELLALDQTAFKQRFAGTPMMRTKRRGLLRNVCVALGNVGDASCLPALEKASHDPEPLIAEHARWAVERIRMRESSSRPA